MNPTIQQKQAGMKDRPILFSGPMVRALADGTKTQTRRIMANQPPSPDYQLATLESTTGDRKLLGKTHWLKAGDSPDYNQPYWSRPFSKGQQLWVKETFMPMPHLNAKAFYRASDPLVGGKWKPSIFMPRALSRFTLQVVSVRVERLNEISEGDAASEGLKFDSSKLGNWSFEWGKQWIGARAAYRELWESINGTGSWAENPWVWVVEFKKLKGGAQ